MSDSLGHIYGIGDPTKYESDWPTEPEAVVILETGEYLLPDECAVLMNIHHKEMEKLKSSPPTLPRVSPEGLVDGEWYVVKECVNCSVEFLLADVDYRGERGFPVAAEAGRPTEFLEAKDMFAIWGPIPEFELEGE